MCPGRLRGRRGARRGSGTGRRRGQARRRARTCALGVALPAAAARTNTPFSAPQRLVSCGDAGSELGRGWSERCGGPGGGGKAVREELRRERLRWGEGSQGPRRVPRESVRLFRDAWGGRPRAGASAFGSGRTPGSWDLVPGGAPHPRREPSSPSAYASASFCVL